jgi:hypothetical protein
MSPLISTARDGDPSDVISIDDDPSRTLSGDHLPVPIESAPD